MLQDGDVDGEHPGTRLRYGHEIEEHVFLYPAAFLYDIGFDERQHGISASEGEEADAKECYEEREVQTN